MASLRVDRDGRCWHDTQTPNRRGATMLKRLAVALMALTAAAVLVLTAVNLALLVDIRDDADAAADAIVGRDGTVAGGVWIAVHSEQRPVLGDDGVVYYGGAPPKTAVAAPAATTTVGTTTTARNATTTSRPATTTTARRTTTTRGVTQAQCNQLETWGLTTAVAFELMLADIQAVDFDGIAVTYPQVRDQMSQASTMRSRISACYSGSERTELLNGIDVSIREWRSIQSTCRESFDWLIDRC